MNKVKIPKNRLRKLKTFTLGQKPYELQSLNPDKVKNNLIDLCSCLLYTSPSPRDRG